MLRAISCHVHAALAMCCVRCCPGRSPVAFHSFAKGGWQSAMTTRANRSAGVNAYVRRKFFLGLAVNFALLAIFYCPIAGAQVNASRQSSLVTPAIEKKVDELLGKMTLDEKIGQLVQYSAGQATGPTSGRTDDRDMVRQGQVGSLFNVTSAHATNELQHIAVDESRLHIPLLFGLDVIHGFRTTFPLNLGLAATWDPGIVEKVSRVAAQEASADGG